MIFFNHELLQLGIIQQNVIMGNRLVTGNSQCIVVFVLFLIGSSDSCIWFLEEGSCRGQ